MAAPVDLKFRRTIATVTVLSVLAATWLTGIYLENDSRAVLLPSQVITVFSEPKPLTAFALTDHENLAFDLASLNGKWSFLFFGFIHCPDVCPTTLALLASVRANLARSVVGAAGIQFVFVSVDPGRDTAGKLRQYVNYFDPDFLGVTGDNAQIANLAAQLGAIYQVMIKPGTYDYPVYHTPAVFLLDPQSRYHALFTPPLDAEVISRSFRIVLELQASNSP